MPTEFRKNPAVCAVWREALGPVEVQIVAMIRLETLPDQALLAGANSELMSSQRASY